ncbi:MAG: transcription termination/antitermination NusG family protein [Erysipelotrichaceae bacterium]|nr:transcription termination/antitermination NusG family protein [Erysipelotrichaceae bacterium]
MNNWYIVYVRQIDEKEINNFFISQGLDSFIPQKDMVFIRNRRKFLVRKPLFPNYIFVRSGLEQYEFWSLLSSLRQQKTGILKMLKYDNEGTPSLNATEQAYLERLLGEKQVIETSCGYLENDRVIITEGPLLGYESQIIAVNKHKCYAKLQIDLFANKIEITVPLNIIKKI